MRRSAHRYWLSKEQKLYKRSYSGPYLLCVHPEAVEPLLEELHKGVCGVTHGVGLWRIEPSPRDTCFRACIEPPKIMRKSVTNVKDMPQIFISQGES